MSSQKSTKFLTAQETAKLLRISKQTLYTAIKKGHIKSFFVSGCHRIDASQFEICNQGGKSDE